MGRRQIKQAFLGTMLSWIGKLFGRHRTKITGRDLAHTEFKTSSQRLGIRFSDGLRRNFRFRWLRRHR